MAKDERNLTKEDVELLIKAICEGMPYGLKALGKGKYLGRLSGLTLSGMFTIFYLEGISPMFGADDIIPFLRPVSSMTDDEKKEAQKLGIIFATKDGKLIFDGVGNVGHENQIKAFEWLNARHFDYRGLIDKGLALTAQDYIYNS